MDRPLIALATGDPAGIGPEIGLAAAREARVREAMRLLLIGPAALRPADVARVTDAEQARAREVSWLETPGPARWDMGRVQRECGAAALASLRAGHELALARSVEALVTAPVSKQALHLAGERVEGQTELLARWCGAVDYEMVAVAERLRVMLLTRHLPLREALNRIEPGAIVARLSLFARALQAWGHPRPMLAVAGFNPHAGEGGLLGREDAELVEPGVRASRERGLDVTGPLAPDSVFLQAAQGRFDGVLALYHDQAFIPVKLHAPERGLTVIAGLPYLRVSPAHGTAFDIAGTGRARPHNLIAALLQAASWAGRDR